MDYLNRGVCSKFRQRNNYLYCGGECQSKYPPIFCANGVNKKKLLDEFENDITKSKFNDCFMITFLKQFANDTSLTWQKFENTTQTRGLETRQNFNLIKQR